jgi:mRNA-degrading endonuclease RelE of RelBE toxin-antitoxin system
MKINIIFSPEFLETFVELSKDIQRRTLRNISDFQKNQELNHLNFHQLEGKVNGKVLHSISVGDYRVIMFTEDDKTFHLLWIKYHDPAYNIMDNIQEIKYDKNNYLVGERDFYSSSGLTKSKTRNLFDRISIQELEALGVPKDKIKSVKNINTVPALDQIKDTLQPDVFENLQYLAHGFHAQDILDDMMRKRRELLDFLDKNVLIPAEESSKIDDDIKESIRNTRDRLESKKTIKEVLDFYFDALKAKRGKQISSAFKSANLKSFEYYEEEIRKRFVLYNPSDL